MAIRASQSDLQRAYEPSRLFDRTISEYLRLESAAITAVPLTLACEFYVDSITVNHVLLGLYDASTFNNWFRISADGSAGGDPLRADTTAAIGARIADTTAGYTANTWHHACGVFASNISRAAYLDGGSKGTNAAPATPAGLDRTTVGISDDSTPDQGTSGRIAWPTIWNVALTDAEVAALGNRQYFTPPWEVRPESIVSMPNMRTLWDPYMLARFTPAGTVLTPPPRIWRPRHRTLYMPGGPRIPIAMHHYKQLMGAN